MSNPRHRVKFQKTLTGTGTGNNGFPLGKLGRDGTLIATKWRLVSGTFSAGTFYIGNGDFDTAFISDFIDYESDPVTGISSSATTPFLAEQIEPIPFSGAAPGEAGEMQAGVLATTATGAWEIALTVYAEVG